MKAAQRKRQDQESRMREAEIARLTASTPQNPGMESLVNLINSIQGPQTQREQFGQEMGFKERSMQQDMGLKEKALGLQAQDQQDTLAYRDRALQSGVQANQQQGILQLLAHLLRMQDMQGNSMVTPNVSGLPGLVEGLNIPGVSGLFNMGGGNANAGLPRGPSDNPNLADDKFAMARAKFGK